MNKQLLYIDFETVYSTKEKYDLRNLDIVRYVRDSRFRVFGVGIAGRHDAPEWVTAKDISGAFVDIGTRIGWQNVTVVGHNIKFDGFILYEKYGIVAGQYIDTMAMSMAVLGKTVKSHAAEHLAEHFGLQAKGFLNTNGKTTLTPEEEKELAAYCLHDVELCRAFHGRLTPGFPAGQYASLDQTVRMFVVPRLQLNVSVLEEAAKNEVLRRETIFNEIGIEKKVFASNDKFPALLREKGYEVPMKESPRKKDEAGNPVLIPALALGDSDFLDMLEGENAELRNLCEARVAAKSTLLETRSKKLAAIGRTGCWPFDVRFSGADQTHRFSGGPGAGGNPQNFTRGSALRQAVEAPDGYDLVVGDFSNIELRIQAYISQDPGLIDGIESGRDIYCDFASVFYGRTITKEDEAARRFGKCLAEGTQVITKNGIKDIQTVTTDDLLWDGETWIRHEGLLDNGIKGVIGLNGLWLTPDHPILCGTSWKEAQLVAQDASILCRALERGSEKLSSLDTSRGREAALLASFESAIVAHQNLLSTSQMSKPDERHAVILAQSSLPRASAIGNTQRLCKMTSTEPGYLIDYHQLYRDATTRIVGSINTTGNEEYGFMKLGMSTGQTFCAMFRISLDGTSRLMKWTESTLTEDMYPAIFGLYLAQKIWPTNDGSKTLRRVFDISNAGPHNRFSVLTEKGPVVVHNCSILGLGYGMGWKKFIRTVRLQTGQIITEEASRRAVELYRIRYGRIPDLWHGFDRLIEHLTTDREVELVSVPVRFTREALILPSGLSIRFPNLRQEPGAHGNLEWVYDVWVKRRLEKRKLYGGKVLENICQGLAGELCKEAMTQMGDSVVGQVHDELLVLCKRGLAQINAAKLKRVMSMAPSWLPEMRLGAEVGVGRNWLEAK